MKFKIALGVFLAVFFGYCSVLVYQTGIFNNPCGDKLFCLASAVEEDESGDGSISQGEQVEYDLTKLLAMPGENQVVKIGSLDPNSDFYYQLELDSKGAAIRKAHLNRHKDLSYKNPKDYFTLLNPIEREKGYEVLSYANDAFILVDQKQKLRLNKLNWQFIESGDDEDGSEYAIFETKIFDATGKPIVALRKTYKMAPGVHHMLCRVEVQNLSTEDLKSRFDMQGPIGLPREGVRTDLRKIISAYRVENDNIETEKLTSLNMRKAYLDWLKGKKSNLELADKMDISLDKAGEFLWVAAVDKYFAAITRPLPEDENPDWLYIDQAEFYEAGLKADTSQKPNETSSSGFKMHVKDFDLSPAETKTFDFQIYLGAKDKDLFQQNELYSSLGFIKAIDFQSCCTFGWVTSLAFIILGIMQWMYTFIPNYGIVIIILVLLVRLMLHPVTKKSQVSMMSMQKLGPKAEEIKRKYENNKAEMNKHMMALYREHGASPILGCLPMVLQMPIWIALYSAIYASIELRGAAFLPFWITDLSAPDALFRFPEFSLPFLGELDSFNLLPLLLGVSFYLQQKLMPHTNKSVDPKVAQQQKMMQWMMPIMMLVFLYKAPSGLNLYIMASTFGGVIEQTVIRKHIREKEQAEAVGKIPVTSKTGGKVKKKKPKPFFKNQM